jgi:hypothetical protein
MSIIIDIDTEDNVVTIAEDTSSGCQYLFSNKQDILDAITNYIDNYVNI